MPEDEDNEENADDYSQQRMEQRIPHIKKCGITKGSEVSAIENEDSRKRGEDPTSPRTARPFVFHNL